MWKKFCRWYLYRHLGWKTNVTVNHPEKFIICLAPHTSNWDFILGQLYAGAEGLHINFSPSTISNSSAQFPSLCHPRGHPLAQP